MLCLPITYTCCRLVYCLCTLSVLLGKYICTCIYISVVHHTLTVCCYFAVCVLFHVLLLTQPVYFQLISCHPCVSVCTFFIVYNICGLVVCIQSVAFWAFLFCIHFMHSYIAESDVHLAAPSFLYSTYTSIYLYPGTCIYMYMYMYSAVKAQAVCVQYVLFPTY